MQHCIVWSITNFDRVLVSESMAGPSRVNVGLSVYLVLLVTILMIIFISWQSISSYICNSRPLHAISKALYGYVSNVVIFSLRARK